MSKVIIYPNDNGGVALVIPSPEARQKLLVSEAEYAEQVNDDGDTVTVCIKPAVYRDQTDDEFLNWIASKDVPQGKSYKIMDDSELPQDQTFFDAWEYQA